MATLIPALGSCAGRMQAGERRLAERLEHKLEDDYLLWWDVPIGPKQTRPDFVVLHPRRGALILEVRDWRLDIIVQTTKEPVASPKTHPVSFAKALNHVRPAFNALRAATRRVVLSEAVLTWHCSAIMPIIVRINF